MASRTDGSKPNDVPIDPESFPVTEAQNILGELVSRVLYGGETITITKHGKPAAKLVPIDAAA